jgi:hypothetical protein
MGSGAGERTVSKQPRSLATRLRAARRLVARDRRSLADSERNHDGTFGSDAQKWLAEYDDALKALAEAIEVVEQL